MELGICPPHRTCGSLVAPGWRNNAKKKFICSSFVFPLSLCVCLWGCTVCGGEMEWTILSVLFFLPAPPSLLFSGVYALDGVGRLLFCGPSRPSCVALDEIEEGGAGNSCLCVCVRLSFFPFSPPPSPCWVHSRSGSLPLMSLVPKKKRQQHLQQQGEASSSGTRAQGPHDGASIFFLHSPLSVSSFFF